MAYAYQIIDKYRAEVKTTAPLHVGSADREENEVLLHPVTDDPFLQASSIAGVLRTISETVNGADATKELFGSSYQKGDDTDRGSRVIISDGVMKLDTVKMEYRPRVKIDPRSGTVSSSKTGGSENDVGHKFGMELIGTGAEIEFFIYLFSTAEKSCKADLEKILAMLRTGGVQIGGQKTNGSGFLKLTSLKYHRFDMTTVEGRRDWAREELMDTSFDKTGTIPKYEEKIKKLPNPGSSKTAYVVRLTGKTEGALLVKGIAAEGVGKDAPDAENMKNAAGKYIVPGSSLKGAVRSRMTYIAEYLQKKGIIEEIFGRTASTGDPGTSGSLIFKDIVLTDGTKTIRQHRIHLDKFTGGVMHGGLFSEKTVSGDINAEIIVKDGTYSDAATGLLLLALRDLAVGMINIGSGYNVGRGFITADKVSISAMQDGAETKEAVISFAGSGDEGRDNIKDQDQVINCCLQALDKWRD